MACSGLLSVELPCEYSTSLSAVIVVTHTCQKEDQVKYGSPYMLDNTPIRYVKTRIPTFLWWIWKE